MKTLMIAVAVLAVTLASLAPKLRPKPTRMAIYVVDRPSATLGGYTPYPIPRDFRFCQVAMMRSAGVLKTALADPRVAGLEIHKEKDPVGWLQERIRVQGGGEVFTVWMVEPCEGEKKILRAIGDVYVSELDRTPKDRWGIPLRIPWKQYARVLEVR